MNELHWSAWTPTHVLVDVSGVSTGVLLRLWGGFYYTKEQWDLLVKDNASSSLTTTTDQTLAQDKLRTRRL